MELGITQLKEMNIKKIYNLMLPSINSIYDKFKYTKIPQDEYLEIVYKVIEESKIKYDEKITYDKYLNNKICDELYKKISIMIKDNRKSYHIISNYINTNFIYNDSKTIEKTFDKFDDFLKRIDFTLDIDLIIRLINENDKLDESLSIVLENHYDKIISGKLDQLFSDSILVSLLETYCDLKNIEIKDDIEEINETYGDIDTLQLYFKEMYNYPLLSPEKERELAIKVANGDLEARDLFLASNLRLVIKIARKYIGRGMEFKDLICEGNIGLIKALDKYDVSKGYKFSTYAISWIRQAISRAIDEKVRNRRIPVHLLNDYRKLKRIENELKMNFGRNPKIEEISEETGFSIKKIKKLYELDNDTISMNSFVNDDGDSELGDFIPDTKTTPEDVFINDNLSDEIMELLKKCNLKEKEIKVLILRYGLNDGVPLTLEAVGQIFGLTRERIRQIEVKAINKIRKSRYIKAFAEYMQFPERATQNIDAFRKDDKKKMYNGSIHNNYSKRSQREFVSKQKEESGKMKERLGIYSFFKEFTKEQVDASIEKLPEEDKVIINLYQNGEKLDQKQTSRLYGSIFRKIGKLLRDPNYKMRTRKNKTENHEFDNSPYAKTLLESVESEKGKVELVAKTTPVIVSNEEAEHVKDENQETNTPQVCDTFELTKDDCIKMLELLKTPTFEKMMTTLSIKDAVIISLRLGYIDGKYFSQKSIADFLGITEEEVRETTEKILLLYRDSINTIIDNAIDVINDKKKTFSLNSKDGK